MKTVIVGGVAGGATAAARLRRLDENAEIIIFERGSYVSYANCGLPYYIGGEIPDKEDLFLQTPEGFRVRYRIDVKTNHEVIKINRSEKTVSVKDCISGRVFEETYDYLILSPGATPFIPEFTIDDNSYVFTLRTVEDALKIKDFSDQNCVKNAVIVGGGFVGTEMAENLRKRGIDVTVIQRGKHLLSTFDADIAAFIHAKMKSEGINLIFGENVQRIENGMVVTDGCSIPADMVIISAGVTPEGILAQDAELEIGVKGAVSVSEDMRTSDEYIYAVGDAIEVLNCISERKAVIPLAGPANKQGRIAADNICGIKSSYRGTQGTAVIKIFDMTAASVGMTEEMLNDMGKDYEKIILSPLSHAGYYPGATVMTLKVLFDKQTYKILGAQCVGYEGVEKRTDVISTAIFAGIEADALRELELSYAPPYSSAKDPVNLAGYIADNIRKGIVKQFYYEDIQSLRKRSDVILLDTRTADEYKDGHAEDFINIPLDELRERISELDVKKPVYVMCQSGLRSYLATRILTANGFDAYNFAGGYRLYTTVYNDSMVSSEAFSCGREKNNRGKEMK